MEKRKKRLIIIVAASIAVVLIAGVIIALVIVFRTPDLPGAGDGVVYQTDTVKFWSGAGTAYLTFENKEEPETPEDGELYGQVFQLHVAGPTIDGWASWITGTWELTDNKLTLKASWKTDAGYEPTTLSDAESGVAKEYTKADGKFTIGINLPSEERKDFILDPVADKVGGAVAKPPCTEFIDANSDGLCDNCGHPAQQTPSEELIIVLDGDAMDGLLTASLEIVPKSSTWRLLFSYGGAPALEIGSGTYAESTGKLVLTVVENGFSMLTVSSFDVLIDETDPKSLLYACELTLFVKGGVGDTVFSLTGQATVKEPEPEPKPELVMKLNGEADVLNFMTATATISIYKGDTFEFESMFGTIISGDCEKQNNGDIKLTGTDFEETVKALAGGIYTLTCTVTDNVPQAGALPLTFVFVSEAQHFTVSFDMNDSLASNIYMTIETDTFNVYEWSLIGGVMTSGTDLKGVKEYLSSLPVPTRFGYQFAGWHFDKIPTIENGISTSQYLSGEKINMSTAATYTWEANDVMGITDDVTLYARWVQPTYITDAADLEKISDDLNGWYILRKDIDLNGISWEPVGDYLGAYELYNTAWWVRSFHGVLDGKGYSIKNLTLTELNQYGTAAFFGSAVDCTVKNITFKDANISIDETPTGHAYISVLAAFVQGMNTVFDDCHVVDAVIDVELTNAYYPSVAGLFGGHWGGIAQYCSVTGTTIDVKTVTNNGLTQSQNIYIGGLVGEGYAWVEFCKAEVDITYTLEDTRVESEFPEAGIGSGAMGGAAVNVYIGGAMASSTYLTNISFEGTIAFDYTQTAGSANINIGGISGYQRYGYIRNCFANAVMNFTNNNTSVVSGQTFSQGGILGSFDTMMGLVGVYFDITGCRVENSLDISSFNETTTTTKVFNASGSIGAIPLDVVVKAMAPLYGIDLEPYTNQDETLNFFGIFESVSLGDTDFETEADMYGNACKDKLGAGWTYSAGSLPTCC